MVEVSIAQRAESREQEKDRKYKDPIQCPICGKVFGEWEEVNGSATIKKWCPNCSPKIKRHVYITKNSLDIDKRKVHKVK